MRENRTPTPDDATDPWPDRPPPVSAAEAAAIREAISAAEQRLEPGQRRRVVAHIAQLLAHYFVPDIPEAAVAALLSDWAGDLAEFPEWAVTDACRDWRRNQTARPTPAAIRALCTASVTRERRTVDAMQEVLETHEAEPDWRWHPEDEPEPSAVCDLRYARQLAAGRNRAARLRLSERFGPVPSGGLRGQDPLHRTGAMVEVCQYVAWHQSIDEAKARAAEILQREAAGRGIVLEEATSGEGAESGGLVEVYSAGRVAGWTGRDDG